MTLPSQSIITIQEALAMIWPSTRASAGVGTYPTTNIKADGVPNSSITTAVPGGNFCWTWRRLMNFIIVDQPRQFEVIVAEPDHCAPNHDHVPSYRLEPGRDDDAIIREAGHVGAGWLGRASVIDGDDQEQFVCTEKDVFCG